jgi:hypothetical protein
MEDFMKRSLATYVAVALLAVASPALASYCSAAMVTHANDFSHGLWHFGQSVVPAMTFDFATLAVLNSICMQKAGAAFWFGFAMVPMIAGLGVSAVALRWKTLKARWYEYQQATFTRRQFGLAT